MSNFISSYKGKEINLEAITPLFQDAQNEVYWLGIDNETAFRCNVYLIKSGDEAIIVDPGSRAFFEEVRQRALEITSLENIKALILCHQDPDVAASIIDWLDIKPDIEIITSDRTNILLPHYGRDDYKYFSINTTLSYTFANGRELEFIEAPYLHFPGAFATYDKVSKFLFSGDIWAALDIDWELVVSDFISHIDNMDLFHVDYMASNIAAKGFVRKLEDKEINAILPQHGSILDKDNIEDAIKYLNELKCGIDIIYGDIDNSGK